MTFDPEEYKQWDQKTRDRAFAALKERIDNPARAWYCKRGRSCNGKPHGEYNYPHARGDQWPPVNDGWFVWAILSGRGSGKTRGGSEWVRKNSDRVGRIAAIAQTTRDVRAVMVEGDSGLIKVCESAKVDYLWEPSKREFTFTRTGSKVHFYTGEEPDSLRGPQHGLAWLDEPAHMPAINEVWSNLLLGLRLGDDPKVLVTTTPLPTEWLKTLVKLPTTRLVRVSTYANLDNLAATYREQVINQFEGTRRGRQELHGEIIEDVEGALWNSEMLELTRKYPEGIERALIALPDARSIPFERIVVAVDPAGTHNERSDETGIVVVGQLDGIFYVLADYSGTYSPDQWAKKVIHAYNHWSADRVVVEKNYGGDMVESNLRNQEESLPITLVNSRRGKAIRAEPVVGLYEQGRVKHIGNFETMETQMVEWVPGRGQSPDRIDALVHGVTHLSGRGRAADIASTVGRPINRGPSAPRVMTGRATVHQGTMLG